MVMRVSENMKFRAITENLFKVQDDYNTIMGKMASQKEINRPSDDPLGMSKVLSYRETQAYTEQYRQNIDTSNAWISMTETKLSSVNDLLVKAREIALSQTTGTASASTREIAAVEVQQLIEEMQTLANSKYGERYLFGGTKTDTVPFSSSEMAASTGSVNTASDNIFDGTIAASGAYTGEVNKTFAVKITTAGELGTAEYQVSGDGGKTWGDVGTVPADGIISIGDGISFEFTAGTADLTENDVFYIDAFAQGYYQGNGRELAVEIAKNMSFDYSISGESVFTAQGSGQSDIFKTLNDLKTALENNDQEGISGQLDNLTAGAEQVNTYIAECGSRMNRLEIAENNLEDLDYKLTELISNTEDVDVAELVTKFAMKEIVLNASYSMASKIGNSTILNFLK